MYLLSDIICMANTKKYKNKSFNLEVEAKRTETKPSFNK